MNVQELRELQRVKRLEVINEMERAKSQGKDISRFGKELEAISAMAKQRIKFISTSSTRDAKKEERLAYIAKRRMEYARWVEICRELDISKTTVRKFIAREDIKHKVKKLHAAAYEYIYYNGHISGLKKRHQKIRALDMRKDGISIKEIASEMEMTESCVWSLITEGEKVGARI